MYSAALPTNALPASRSTGRFASTLDWFWSRRPTNFRRYSFRDRWRATGKLEQVAELLLDTTSLSSWWPQLGGVRLDEAGEENGARRAFRSRVRGFLPYELDLDFRIVDVEFPGRFAIELHGDLRGKGGGTLQQVGDHVVVDFELTLSVARPLLTLLSLIVRPLLAAQHRWVMRQGEQGLLSELSRRNAIA
jgi:hypothetical protein